MELRIENSFELLSQEEWDKYLGVDFFDNMIIKYDALGAAEDIFKSINAPRLSDLIQEYKGIDEANRFLESMNLDPLKY